MTTAREKIINSVIVRRGDIFTASTMADAIGETKAHMTNLLNHLATVGDLHLVTQGGGETRYTRHHRGCYLLSQPWDKKLKLA